MHSKSAAARIFWLLPLFRRLFLHLLFTLLQVGDPILASNLTRRVDYAWFMVAALEDDALIHQATAIVGCRSPSALAHSAAAC